ncbi:TetR/AcrR family transcriptional regulator [Bifidobacterium pseudolongum]|uniref:TetR-type transcriptional regulator n=1 Tax=Bifidobacterium pseudolongum subsp. globosum TaxID=1690 RepID=A0A2N3QWW5_9BIFI|nr:TetR/AcrR family transcriptional regulator [Bifidobacterium pseudolongum]PKU97194.1 TetR-type transcriptional regulator [Bifidobacterium pseudolongum subsp. globosum]PKV05909.1 TetR-type transcriptional regulator [Bifidobacterium pseudolongum subsp. globosum]RYQ64070.1 TetR family transcriptional regulator [Bifidobacterium pseudolongum subsp. globosum]RYQ75455.1 TetR family transcriptional regulator [Bifidobacterium pseudolongum subsp. globosum]RYQ76881.1 TetR family transcriptional regulat
MKETKEQQRERTDSKIMRATLEIIIAQGIGAVNIESVARRSGVAKTTIYRRYANTDDLIRHLTLTVAPSLDFSALEPSRESLRTVLRRIIDCFDEEFELKAIGVVLSSENAHLRNIANSVIEPAAERFYDFLRRGMAIGAFRDGLDAPFLFQTVLGSMLAYKALGTSSAVPHADWAGNMTGLLWASIRPAQ